MLIWLLLDCKESKVELSIYTWHLCRTGIRNFVANLGIKY